MREVLQLFRDINKLCKRKQRLLRSVTEYYKLELPEILSERLNIKYHIILNIRRRWLPMPVFLPGKLYGQRNLVGYSPWGHKESDRTERLTLLMFIFEILE